jgi:hypothetical protein
MIFVRPHGSHLLGQRLCHPSDRFPLSRSVGQGLSTSRTCANRKLKTTANLRVRKLHPVTELTER